MAGQRKGKFTKKHSKFKSKKMEETEEIKFLDERIAAGAPARGTNPLATTILRETEHVATEKFDNQPYAGAKFFEQLPLSENTKKGLKDSKYTHMTAIQRASLPHSLCGRDVLGAAKTGSGKTLAFLLPVIEKLYRLRWSSDDGVGAIIISPTRELAFQIFEELKKVGKYHSLSGGLLIGGRKDVGTEKEHVGRLNILVCTPGRLLQHMDETPDFDCSQLQILVLDEADRILDMGFSGTLNAIVAQLNKERQTLLFSATQTRSVQDLARLSLEDPEYLAVHAESAAATPARLQQTAMIVPLDEKMDMLWSFVKTHLRTKTLVFLSSRKQAKFVYEIFKRLRPGVPVKCLHGRMKQSQRTLGYASYCETKHTVLFCTDVAARGLDFPAVDWVVQMDCPDDVASYIHRVGRTARYTAFGRSLIFLTPSEEVMLEDLKAAKIPVKVIKPNKEKIQSVSGAIAALVSKNAELKYLGQRAFVTYLRSIHFQKNKAVFDVTKLPITEYAVSLGLPTTPRVRFIKSANDKNRVLKQMDSDHSEDEVPDDEKESEEEEESEKENEEDGIPEETAMDTAGPDTKPKVAKEKRTKLDRLFKRKNTSVFSTAHEKMRSRDDEDPEEEEFLSKKRPRPENEEEVDPTTSVLIRNSGVKVLKRKKLKIDPGKAGSQRMVFDDEGNALPPLAALARKNDETSNGADTGESVAQAAGERFQRIKEEMRRRDKEDRLLEKQRLREKRYKNKTKVKAAAEEAKGDRGVQLRKDSDSELDESMDERPRRNVGGGSSSDLDVSDQTGPRCGSDADSDENKPVKQKKRFAKLTIAEQEDLALKLLQSRNGT